MISSPHRPGRSFSIFCAARCPRLSIPGLNVVDVRDVALGHLLACERGRVGERYILGSREFDAAADSAANWPRSPAGKRPRWSCRTSWHGRLGVVSTALAQITGKPPRVPLEAVRMAKKKIWVSHEKAARELGFHPAPPPSARRCGEVVRARCDARAGRMKRPALRRRRPARMHADWVDPLE